MSNWIPLTVPVHEQRGMSRTQSHTVSRSVYILCSRSRNLDVGLRSKLHTVDDIRARDTNASKIFTRK